MNKKKIKGCQKMMQDTKEYDYKKNNNNNKSNSLTKTMNIYDHSG